MLPHDGIGGWTPMPRKLNPASNRIADAKFAAEVLGFKWRTGQASTTGEAYEVQSRYKEFGKAKYNFNNTLNSLMYVVESPDSFYPADDKTGATIMRYKENNLICVDLFILWLNIR